MQDSIGQRLERLRHGLGGWRELFDGLDRRERINGLKSGFIELFCIKQSRSNLLRGTLLLMFSTPHREIGQGVGMQAVRVPNDKLK